MQTEKSIHAIDQYINNTPEKAFSYVANERFYIFYAMNLDIKCLLGSFNTVSVFKDWPLVSNLIWSCISVGQILSS